MNTETDRFEATLINVDDNEPARYARSRILKNAGFSVHDARTGQEALDLVAACDPDLVLLDVHLPDVNGMEVCRRIKARHKGPSVLVLQISATAVSTPHTLAALNNGADAYLTEPVDPDVLVATTRAMLRLRRVERDLVDANHRLELVNLELRRSNDDLQQFAFVASHDLQEPLRAVTTFGQLLERSLDGRLNEQQKSYFVHIADGANRMRKLIDDLLTYSQVSRKAGSTFGPVDLASVVTLALNNLEERIAESKPRLTIDHLPVVQGDYAQFGRVFQNLIGNAIKYHDARRPIEIHISAEVHTPNEWVISVRDNGVGIAPEYQERVFLPFKRLHGREIPGTGIGLAVCQRVIEAHGGRIWVDSVVGEGSTFRFILTGSHS